MRQVSLIERLLSQGEVYALNVRSWALADIRRPAAANDRKWWVAERPLSDD